MILSYKDGSFISKILPLHCTSYLESKGWHMSETMGKKATIWQKQLQSGIDEFILVPMDTDLKDYVTRIVDLIETLKKIEDRNIESIVSDLLQSNCDTFRVVAYKGRPESNIPLVDASTLIKRSVDMLASAAHSITSKRPYYASRHPKDVEDFLKKLKLGHTERGSFIVSMHVTVQPRMRDMFSESKLNDDNLIQESDEPFERQVIIQLSRLTNLAIDAANAMDFKRFTDAISAGLNANFCEALADIASVCGEDGTYFDINWAPNRPVSKAWNIKSKFSIRPDTADALKEAGKLLRSNTPEPNVEICGYVVRLNKESNTEIGEIKIVDTLSENSRSVYLQLDEEKYQQAIEAHSKGHLIRVIGNIDKQGKKSVINDFQTFQLIKDDEE